MNTNQIHPKVILDDYWVQISALLGGLNLAIGVALLFVETGRAPPAALPLGVGATGLLWGWYEASTVNADKTEGEA
jgi:hypothetical protein